MDPGESLRLRFIRGPHEFNLHLRLRLPATKLILLIEQKVPGSLAFLNGESRESQFLSMEGHHPLQVDRTDHIDIVKKEWFIQTLGICEKEPCGFLETASGVQQD